MAKYRYIVLLYVIINSQTSPAQNQANVWYFGYNAGVDFNESTPTPLLDGLINTDEGCASIADANGDLLFYTDGTTVYNRIHKPLLNGTDLNGDISSTNSALIVQKPGDSDRYYIFTVDFQARPDGLQYSEVDMSLDNGLGGITSIKNRLLATPTTEQLTAIKSSLNDDIWIVSHKWDSDEFISFKVTSSGVSTTPVVSKSGIPVSGNTLKAIGQMKISPDGKKIAVARNEDVFILADFNSETGTITNTEILPLQFDESFSDQKYGVEFSPNSKLLYLTVIGIGIFQLDIYAGDIKAIEKSKIIVTPGQDPYSSLQLGPDGKIYCSMPGSNPNYLTAIENPNIRGLGCSFVRESIYLGGRRVAVGLPPFIQSYFDIQEFESENVCFGSETSFKLKDDVDSAIWDFGDPDSGSLNTSNELEPLHQFTKPGVYEVQVKVIFDGDEITKKRTIEIYELPVLTTVETIKFCDTENDNKEVTDLTELSAKLISNADKTKFNIDYFATMQDIESEIPIANPESFTIQLSDSPIEVFALITNKSNSACYVVTKVQLQLFESPEPVSDVPNLIICDNDSFGDFTDGKVIIDLNRQNTFILNGKNPDDFEIKYYQDAGYQNEISNTSFYTNQFSQEKIYARISNKKHPQCFTDLSFDIEIKPVPVLEDEINLIQCDDDQDGFTTFNLLQAIPNKYRTNSYQTYFYRTLSDATDQINAIDNLISYVNIQESTDRVWMRVMNANNCSTTAAINLKVVVSQIPTSYKLDYAVCDTNNNGIGVFDLTQAKSDVRSLFPASQSISIDFYQTKLDALAERNRIEILSNYQNTNSPFSQQLYIRVENLLDNSCIGLSPAISLFVDPLPKLNNVVIPVACDENDDGYYAFDLRNLKSLLHTNSGELRFEIYDENGTEISNLLDVPFISRAQTLNIKARYKNSVKTECFSQAKIDLKIVDKVLAYPVDKQFACVNAGQNTFDFDTTNLNEHILQNQANVRITYILENGERFLNQLPNPFTTSSQQVKALVENLDNSACSAQSIVEFLVYEKLNLTMPEVWPICEGGSVTIKADSGIKNYLWSTGETTQSITVEQSGAYSLQVSNTDFSDESCIVTKEIQVIKSEAPQSLSIETLDWTESSNEIRVAVSGNGEYEYSINGIDFQNHPTFTNLKPGEYNVNVRDINGCGYLEQKVYLYFYPKFFTPNGDGYHDTWHLYNANQEPKTLITIFDRFGKLIKELRGSESGWDGTFNGQLVPSSDYWFYIKRENGESYKGHFTLKR